VTTPLVTNAGTLAVSATGANVITASTNGTERLRITSTGSVGIGTSSPAAFAGYTTLGINNATNGGILDLMQGGSMRMRLIGLAGSAVIETPASLPILFSPAGTEKMRITSTGSVGVGTSSPAAKLDVSADALIHGATVGRGGGAISTNTAVGSGALSSNTTGFNNTANGFQALFSNITGNNNTANGVLALRENTGNNNTANGFEALADSTTGSSNTATGFRALQNNTTGNNNTANGVNALLSNTTGNGNTANGDNALVNTTGSFNTANGLQALADSTTGGNNIGIGLNAGRSTSPRTITTANNEICIGNNDHTGAFIKIALTVTSDARDKAELAPIPHGLEFVNALQPTEYQFKAGGRDGEADGIRRYGFLAQDVLAAEGDNPVIVNTDDPDSLKMTHDYLIPVLVNAVKELTAQVNDLMAEVAALKGQ
jgi:hypothetical protein